MALETRVANGNKVGNNSGLNKGKDYFSLPEKNVQRYVDHKCYENHIENASVSFLWNILSSAFYFPAYHTAPVAEVLVITWPLKNRVGIRVNKREKKPESSYWPMLYKTFQKVPLSTSIYISLA